VDISSARLVRASVLRVRWDHLFADLEGQLEAEQAAEFAGEVAERVRAERAAVRLADRLLAPAAGLLTWYLLDGHRLEGVVADAGAGWVLIEAASGQVLLPLHALSGVAGLDAAVAIGPVPQPRRLTLGVVLRGLATDRTPVQLHLVDGSVVNGTLDRVWADHVDLALHPVGEPRRRQAVSAVRSIPFAAVLRLCA
jgi:sRNA-binding regulator protein Hfq